MKTKFLKVSLLILAFSLVLGAAVATVISANETVTANGPEIISQNIEYNENFSIMYAVKKSSVTDTANLELNIYDKDPADPEAKLLRTYTEYKEVIADSNVNNLSADSYVFTTDGVAATAMLQNIYVQAACGDKVSNVMRYSVAEYLYSRLATEGISTLQSNFYNSTIRFGANAQIIIGKVDPENTSALITNYRYVTVDGGKIDGYETGVYPIGAELNVVKDDAANTEQWRHCYYDERGVFANEKVESTFTVKDTTKNILSLVDIVRPRLGVEDFESFEAGSFTVSKGADSADGIFRRPNAGNAAGVKYYFEEDATHGMVAKLNLYGYNYVTMLRRNNAVFAESEATAYECSFDLKIDMPRYKGLKETAVRFMWYTNDDTNLSQTYVYVNHIEDSEGNVIGQELHNHGNKNDASRLVVMDENGWCNVRMVVYKGSNTVHYYFNGVKSTWTTTLNASYNGDIASLAGVGFRMGDYTDSTDNNVEVHDTHLYFDNVFYGFTKEAKPQ